jgi:hypothetical protein
MEPSGNADRTCSSMRPAFSMSSSHDLLAMQMQEP